MTTETNNQEQKLKEEIDLKKKELEALQKKDLKPLLTIDFKDSKYIEGFKFGFVLGLVIMALIFLLK